jgi:hypothetical protein
MGKAGWRPDRSGRVSARANSLRKPSVRLHRPGRLVASDLPHLHGAIRIRSPPSRHPSWVLTARLRKSTGIEKLRRSVSKNRYSSRRAITQPVPANAATAPTKEASSPVSDIDRPRCYACTHWVALRRWDVTASTPKHAEYAPSCESLISAPSLPPDRPVTSATLCRRFDSSPAV